MNFPADVFVIRKHSFFITMFWNHFKLTDLTDTLYEYKSSAKEYQVVSSWLPDEMNFEKLALQVLRNPPNI